MIKTKTINNERNLILMNNIDNINNIPTTRYQGSKRKILPWIYDCVKDVEFNTVLDAFGGSGMVSYLFKHMGKRVTYNDLFHFNYIIGKSIIENNKVKLTETDVEYLTNANPISKGFIADTFKNIYFLDEENNWLDMVINRIERFSDYYSGPQLCYKKTIAYNALFQSCLAKRPYNLFHRKNLDMRTRDVERGFGNKTTWDKPFPDHFRTYVKEINQSVFESDVKCKAICKDVFAIKTNYYDLVYLDPPYLKKESSNESSDYLGCYHFLEGIANYYEWGNLIDKDSVNKRIKREYAPNYFNPTDAYATFERLIKKFRKSVIVLSYRYGGIPTIDELSNIMLKYKAHLDVYDKHYKYALNKQNENVAFNREYLLIGY